MSVNKILQNSIAFYCLHILLLLNHFSSKCWRNECHQWRTWKDAHRSRSLGRIYGEGETQQLHLLSSFAQMSCHMIFPSVACSLSWLSKAMKNLAMTTHELLALLPTRTRASWQNTWQNLEIQFLQSSDNLLFVKPSKSFLPFIHDVYSPAM